MNSSYVNGWKCFLDCLKDQIKKSVIISIFPLEVYFIIDVHIASYDSDKTSYPSTGNVN